MMGNQLPLTLTYITLTSLILTSGVISKATDSGDKPNIIFIMVDDLGFHDVGFHGSEIATPNIDSLANTGVRLESYYTSPMCSPSRSQFMTGRYAIHMGLQHYIINWGEPYGLPAHQDTVPMRLREAGYSTHMVGKWHCGFFNASAVPQARGFDTFYGFYGGSVDFFKHTGPWQAKKIARFGGPFKDIHTEKGPVPNEDTAGTYLTELLADQVLKVVERREADKPFFLYWAPLAVHEPKQAPDHYLQRNVANLNPDDQARKQHAGQLTALDDAIGNLTRKLKSEGIMDNTVIVLTSDNGGASNLGSNNFPLRGKKAELWEGGVRVVCVVAGKGVPRGADRYHLVHVTDWMPTLVRLGGGDLSDMADQLDGVDQWEAITGYAGYSPRTKLLHNIDPGSTNSGKDRLYPEIGFNTQTRAAVRVGDYKLLTGAPGGGVLDSQTRRQAHQMYEPPEKSIRLYNVMDDAREVNDLSLSMPDKVRELLQELAQYQKTMWPQANKKYDPASAEKAAMTGYWDPWK